jgi:heterogeneous nuclear ribonucleoprotein F/H
LKRSRDSIELPADKRQRTNDAIDENEKSSQVLLPTIEEMEVDLKKLELNRVVRIKGVPWQAGPADIVEFFDGIRIADKGLYLALNERGESTGEAYVFLASERDVPSALARHKDNIGTRYIEVYESCMADVQCQPLRHPSGAMMLPPRFAGVSRNDAEALREIDSLVCRSVFVSQMPYRAAFGDVVEFFSGLPIVAHGVRFVRTPSGRPSGECFICFEQQSSAAAAVSRSGRTLIWRPVAVVPATLDQLTRLLGIQTDSATSAALAQQQGTAPGDDESSSSASSSSPSSSSPSSSSTKRATRPSVTIPLHIRQPFVSFDGQLAAYNALLKLV